jgi:Spy/CpxP family protein refolding chaperone
MIKKVILAVALAAAVATPALAAVAARTNQEKPWDDASPSVHQSSFDAYKNGVYVGSDPDPRIRLHLEQDGTSK